MNSRYFIIGIILMVVSSGIVIIVPNDVEATGGEHCLFVGGESSLMSNAHNWYGWNPPEAGDYVEFGNYGGFTYTNPCTWDVTTAFAGVNIDNYYTSVITQSTAMNCGALWLGGGTLTGNNQPISFTSFSKTGGTLTANVANLQAFGDITSNDALQVRTFAVKANIFVNQSIRTYGSGFTCGFTVDSGKTITSSSYIQAYVYSQDYWSNLGTIVATSMMINFPWNSFTDSFGNIDAPLTLNTEGSSRAWSMNADYSSDYSVTIKATTGACTLNLKGYDLSCSELKIDQKATLKNDVDYSVVTVDTLSMLSSTSVLNCYMMCIKFEDYNYSQYYDLLVNGEVVGGTVPYNESDPYLWFEYQNFSGINTFEWVESNYTGDIFDYDIGYWIYSSWYRTGSYYREPYISDGHFVLTTTDVSGTMEVGARKKIGVNAIQYDMTYEFIIEDSSTGKYGLKLTNEGNYEGHEVYFYDDVDADLHLGIKHNLNPSYGTYSIELGDSSSYLESIGKFYIQLYREILDNDTVLTETNVYFIYNSGGLDKVGSYSSYDDLISMSAVNYIEIEGDSVDGILVDSYEVYIDNITFETMYYDSVEIVSSPITEFDLYYGVYSYNVYANQWNCNYYLIDSSGYFTISSYGNIHGSPIVGSYDLYVIVEWNGLYAYQNYTLVVTDDLFHLEILTTPILTVVYGQSYSYAPWCTDSTAHWIVYDSMGYLSIDSESSVGMISLVYGGGIVNNTDVILICYNDDEIVYQNWTITVVISGIYTDVQTFGINIVAYDYVLCQYVNVNVSSEEHPYVEAHETNNQLKPMIYDYEFISGSNLNSLMWLMIFFIPILLLTYVYREIGLIAGTVLMALVGGYSMPSGELILVMGMVVATIMMFKKRGDR